VKLETYALDDATSSCDAVPGVIATRDCDSWRGIARALACASAVGGSAG
jgi:hypothetical protein